MSSVVATKLRTKELRDSCTQLSQSPNETHFDQLCISTHAQSRALYESERILTQELSLDEIEKSIIRMTQALSDQELQEHVVTLLQAGQFKQARQVIEAREESEIDQLTEMNFELVDHLYELKQALQSHPESFIEPRPESVKPTISRLTNSQDEQSEYLSLYQSRPSLRARVEQVLCDLASVSSPEELKSLQPSRHDASATRSIYHLSGRFHPYKQAVGAREVWYLEISSADRILIGFDRSAHTTEIVYTADTNPHGGNKGNAYRPEVENAINRFLYRK